MGTEPARSSHVSKDRTLAAMRQGPIPGAHGRVRPLTMLGDPVLHAPCKEVTDFGPELSRLVEDLFATMYAAQGVGFAANQIGESLRVFVYDCPDDEEVRHLGHVVNPRLVEADGLVLRGPEGCLSLPGLEAGTERYDHAVVEGFTMTGEPITVHGTGFFARCLQHECDHVEGTVYADRVTGWRHRRLMRQVRRASWRR
jgi:peptide deformylase